MIFNNINNPKRGSENEKRANWYNYYAGFSHTFVRALIRDLNLRENSIILDPWNGSGATTYAASIEGYSSIGSDLNPPMYIIAKSKLANKIDILDAKAKIKNLRVNAFSCHFESSDYLTNWFDIKTAKYIRYIDYFICKKTNVNIDTKLSSLSKVDCLLYVALFNTVRLLLKPFVSSNPTWVKKAKQEESKLNVDNRFIKESIINMLNNKLDIDDIPVTSKDAMFLSDDVKNLSLKDNSVDVVITSPPYCTRIDYGVATSPEAAVLYGNQPIQIEDTRRKLMGRTTIDRDFNFGVSFGITADKFLSSIYEHKSRASNSYYFKNFYQYFMDLDLSLSELNRVLKNNGYLVCVVQDSYYKEIYCDLSLIIIELLCNKGFKLLQKKEFESAVNMANLNNKSKAYRDKTVATEYVLIFSRG
ncbi:DNA methyltransferase [Providencia sp. PROV128]|uniref:DNA methyltransferase n=1 Tax=Providencia sp. PROV128 TaxID=2949838 RepID=UPI002349CA04|nr:DNA methyltransferase [Providencia sp. PROV128]